MPGAYPRLDHLKSALLEQAAVLLKNILLDWKGPPGSNTRASQEHL
jgi:hypothetical protein